MGTLEELVGMTTGANNEENATFIVEDSTYKNSSVVYLSPVTMEDLNIWYGVAILLEGNNNSKVVCTVLTEENCDKDKIRMNEVARNKFGVSLGDSVTLGSFLEIPKGRKIVVRPIRDGCDFVQENLFESYLRPYFFGANRPVNNDDVFYVKGRARTIQFKVIKTIPSPFCIVGPSTIIHCEEQKVANKRRKNEAGICSKKVEGPQIASQSSAEPPVPNSAGLLEQNADQLPEQNDNEFPQINADTLRIQNGDTSSAHEDENEEIEVIKVIKGSEASGLTSIEDKIKLACSLQNQGELKKAAHAFVDVIKTQIKQLGLSHPDILPFKQTLATILFDLKRFHGLLQLLLKDQHLQNNSSRTFLDTKLLFAIFLISKNNYQDATRLFFGATEHFNSLEYSFVEGLKIKVVFASVLYCRNKLELALKYLTDNTLRGPTCVDKDAFVYVLKRINDLENLKLHSLDPNYPDALIIKYHIGWFYYKLQDYNLATETLQEILPSMKETIGSDHICTTLTEDLLKTCKKEIVQERV